MKPTEKDIEKVRLILKCSFYENYEETKEVIKYMAQLLADQREEYAKVAEAWEYSKYCGDQCLQELSDDLAKAIRES